MEDSQSVILRGGGGGRRTSPSLSLTEYHSLSLTEYPPPSLTSPLPRRGEATSPVLSVRSRRDPLQRAIKKNAVAEVRDLLIRGDGIDIGKRQGALYEAAESGKRDIVMVLIEHGVDIKAKGLMGLTALHHAAYASSLDLVDLLIHTCRLTDGAEACIAYINATDHLGHTALHLAAGPRSGDVTKSPSSRSSVIRALLSNGAAIDATDMLGQTALHHAVQTGSGITVRELLLSGANTMVVDHQGSEAFQYAMGFITRQNPPLPTKSKATASPGMVSGGQVGTSAADLTAAPSKRRVLVGYGPSVTAQLRLMKLLLLFSFDQLIDHEGEGEGIRPQEPRSTLILQAKECLKNCPWGKLEEPDEKLLGFLSHLSWGLVHTNTDRAMLVDMIAMENVVITIGDLGHRQTQLGGHVVQFQWEMPAVLENMRQEMGQTLADSNEAVFRLLSNYVAITGSESAYECSTCGQFLEKNWRRVAESVLTIATKALMMLSASNSDDEPGLLVWRSTRQSMTIHLSDYMEDKNEFLDAMGWLCSAIRDSLNGTGRSSARVSKCVRNASIDINGLPHIHAFELKPLESLGLFGDDANSMCWTSLFHSAVIAQRQLRRSWGLGLELPFGVMIQLAAVENYYRVNGGIILLGYFTALIPVATDSENRSIQWHVESIPGNYDNILQPEKLVSASEQSWFKTEDTSVLEQARCFIGWFEKANILLGSRPLVERWELRASINTSNQEWTLQREGFGTAGQIAATLGPISLKTTATQGWVFHSNVQQFKPLDQYHHALHISRDKVALVIDSGSEQAWLVPFLSLILHLCHRYCQQSLFDPDMVNPIQFSEPSSNGALEALRVLGKSGDQVIFGSGEGGQTLRQLVLRLMGNLVNTVQTSRPSDGKHIFATELIDMIFEPTRGSPLKRLAVTENSRSWWHLAGKADVVVVCSNIGPAIEPVKSESPSANSCECSVLPKGRYYLAAHTWCLKMLFERAGNGWMNNKDGIMRLDDEFIWRIETPPWARCHADMQACIWRDESKMRTLLQQVLRGKGKCQDVRRANRAPLVTTHGVVVFGTPAGTSLLEDGKMPIEKKLLTLARRMNNLMVNGNG